MVPPNQHKGFLNEFRAFLGFLRNLWGILSGVSLFFPLSNVLFKVMPMRSTQDDPSGGWSYISPGLVTSLTTMITLFILLWTFGQRRIFSNPAEMDSISRRAWVALTIGLLSLIIYLGLHTTIYELVYRPLGVTHGDPGAFVGDVFLLLSYAGFFALVTRAFVLLGMKEYLIDDTLRA